MIFTKPFVAKKVLIISLAFFTFSIFSFGQANDEPQNFWDRVQYGGGVGLNFGNGFFSGMLAPNALYRFNPYVATGTGLNFQYSSFRNDFNSTVLGGSVIGLFNPSQEIQFSTEFEQLYVSRNIEDAFNGDIKDKYWYPALFLGIGFNNGNVTFGIRYDVLYDPNKSIQPEAWMPFVRFWF